MKYSGAQIQVTIQVTTLFYLPPVRCTIQDCFAEGVAAVVVVIIVQQVACGPGPGRSTVMHINQDRDFFLWVIPMHHFSYNSIFLKTSLFLIKISLFTLKTEK